MVKRWILYVFHHIKKIKKKKKQSRKIVGESSLLLGWCWCWLSFWWPHVPIWKMCLFSAFWVRHRGLKLAVAGCRWPGKNFVFCVSLTVYFKFIWFVSVFLEELLFSCSVMSGSFATPRVVACQAPKSMGFSRQEYWSGLPFPSPGNFPNAVIEPESNTLAGDPLPLSPWFNKALYHLTQWWWIHGFDSCIRKIPWGKERWFIPVFLPGKSHGQRSLVGHSPCHCKELDTTEATRHA